MKTPAEMLAARRLRPVTRLTYTMLQQMRKQDELREKAKMPDYDDHYPRRAGPSRNPPQPSKQERAMSNISFDQTDSRLTPKHVESIQAWLETPAVTEALKAGASFDLAWEIHEIGNPNYRQGTDTDATDVDGEQLVDDREQIWVALPQLKLRRPTDNEVVVQDFEAISEGLESKLDALIHVAHEGEKDQRAFFQTSMNLLLDTQASVARGAATKPPKRRPYLTVLLAAFWFGFGAAFGAANPSTVTQVFDRFAQIFS